MTKLEKLRDEQTEKLNIIGKSLGWDIVKITQAYRSGWDECDKLWRAHCEKLVLALKVYAMTNETFPEYGDVAREVIKRHVEFTGE
jgi:hypothetical protein